MCSNTPLQRYGHSKFSKMRGQSSVGRSSIMSIHIIIYWCHSSSSLHEERSARGVNINHMFPGGLDAYCRPSWSLDNPLVKTIGDMDITRTWSRWFTCRFRQKAVCGCIINDVRVTLSEWLINHETCAAHLTSAATKPPLHHSNGRQRTSKHSCFIHQFRFHVNNLERSAFHGNYELLKKKKKKKKNYADDELLI